MEMNHPMTNWVTIQVITNSNDKKTMDVVKT